MTNTRTLKIMPAREVRFADAVLLDDGLGLVTATANKQAPGDPVVTLTFSIPNRYGDTRLDFWPEQLVAVLPPINCTACGVRPIPEASR